VLVERIGWKRESEIGDGVRFDEKREYVR